jgi:autotransporter-associated beta strand protein
VSISKIGAGTLSLNTANTGTLGTPANPNLWSITGGAFNGGIFDSILSVSAGNNLGAVPTATTTTVILDAGTLQVRGTGLNPATGATRRIQVNAAGGAIVDTANNLYQSPIINNAGSGSSLYLSNTSGTTTFSGVISGSGSTTINAGGTIALTNNNSFTGGVVLNSGILSINGGLGSGANPGSLNPSWLTFASSSTLQFGTNILTGAAIDTNRGFLINDGVTATIDTQGFTVFTNNGISAQPGQTGVLNKIGSGTLYLGNNNASDRDNVFLTVVATQGNLVLNKGLSFTHAVGGGGLTVNGGTVTLAGNGGDQIDDAAPVTVTTGTFDLAGKNEKIGSLSGAATGIVTLGAGKLTVGKFTGTPVFAGVISGAGGVIKDGASTQVLSGNNTYTGPTIISGGTLEVSGSINGSIDPRLWGGLRQPASLRWRPLLSYHRHRVEYCRLERGGRNARFASDGSTDLYGRHDRV